jgi:hypothetical protein
MRPGPGPLRTTARNPVLDAAVASKRAADEACFQLAVDAMHDELRAERIGRGIVASIDRLTGGEG